MTASPVNKQSDNDWGFASFRHKFLQLHSLPPTFLYDRYLTSECAVQPIMPRGC